MITSSKMPELSKERRDISKKTESDGRSQSRRLNPAGPAAVSVAGLFRVSLSSLLFSAKTLFRQLPLLTDTLLYWPAKNVLISERFLSSWPGIRRSGVEGDISTPLTSPTIDPPEDKLRC